MIDDMLEKWEDEEAVEGTNSYFLGRSDLTCGCDKCRKRLCKPIQKIYAPQKCED